MTNISLKAGRTLAILSGAIVLASAGFAAPPKHKKPPVKKPVVKKGANTAMIAAGKKVYDASGCKNCHSIGDAGGKTAPPLTSIGLEKGVSVKWFGEFVTDPKSKHPESPMPAFGETVKGKDLVALGNYLMSLKAKK